MAKQQNRLGRSIAGAVTALLLMLSVSSALASNEFKPECDEFTDAVPDVEISTRVLTIRVTDHGLSSSAADMKDSASDPADEKVVSPALAEVVEVKLSDGSETSSVEEDDSAPVSDLPETALKLPGVSERDQPRFRRQMYRTDI